MDAHSASPSSLNTLTVAPVPESAYAKMKKMMSSPRGKRRASSTASPKTFGVALDEILSRDAPENGVPNIVHKMCQYLIKNGLQVEGIFRVNANMKTVDKLKTSIEKTGDADFEDANDVMAVASLLKMFLRELPDAVIPYHMQPGFIKAQSMREDKERYLEILRFLILKMPDSNYYLLKYLVNFLNKVSENADSNKMTGVALAVVFGPNIFRCSDSLQGLQEQACVNAVTCKIIEQYDFLFTTDSTAEEQDTVDGSLSIRNSPKAKPARPPPPKFSHQAGSPRKMHPDENSNLVESSLPKPLARSMTDSLLDFDASSSSVEINGPQNQPGRKKYHRSVTITSPEPSRSLSPQKPYRSSSIPPIASPSSKQIVDTTIRDAVKEHLFGGELVTSSSESDTQGLEPANSTEQSPIDEDVQRPIRDVLKQFTAEKLSDLRLSLKDENGGKISSPKELKTNHFKAMQNMHKDTRPMSFPYNGTTSGIDSESLDEMKERWTGTLTSLTLHRAPPPKTRRQRRHSGKSKSEDIDQLMRNRENTINNNTQTQNTSSLNHSLNKANQANKKSANPLLVKIKNGKNSRSFDESSEGIEASSSQNIVKLRQAEGPASPRKVVSNEVSSLAEEDSRNNNAVITESVSKEKPVIPRLDLFRVQQEGSEDQETRFSPKEKFFQILTDSPIRSPRNFSTEGGPEEPHSIHRQQIFLEKRQDTVPILDMTPKELKKRIEYLRKTINNYETSFERDYSRLPKASEKAPVQKYIAELGRAKKQLKELMTEIKENPDRAEVSQTAPELSFAPSLRDPNLREDKPTKENTLHLLLKKLQDKRRSAGRPEEIEVMSAEQLKEEKLAVQKALLQFENLHGRPTSKEDKSLMRPIYERYRRIKRMIACGKATSTTIASEQTPDTAQSQDSMEKSPKDLEPIIEGMTLNDSSLNRNSKKDDENDSNKEDELNDTFNITRKPMEVSQQALRNESSLSTVSQAITFTSTMNEAVLHDATLEELLKQQKMAKKSKKVLGKTLKEYEDQFFVDTGRKVLKEDRGPYEAEYTEYKQIKARLRLLEALITKKRINQTV